MAPNRVDRLLVFVSLALGCDAALYSKIQSVLKVDFDFIIVGGGNAGAVLANRLTENSRVQVLVVENGPSHQGVLASQIPGYFTSLFGTEYHYVFQTTPQVALNNRTLTYERGRILGGSTGVNAMIWTRGSAADYDGWATLSGDQGWSWKKLLPYFLKSERLVAPADGHNTANQVDPSVHGKNGNVQVSVSGYALETDGRVVAASKELGGEFAYNKDTNSGNPLGLSWMQGSIGKGERSSAAAAYLPPSVLNRKNLHVVVNTRVTRVLSKGKGPKLAIKTIEVATDTRVNGKRLELTAKKEVILAAGAIDTPHILLHSGIGDTKDLEPLGIKTVLHSPSVGKNLTDHPLSIISWNVNSTTTSDALRNPDAQAAALAQWNAKRQGPLTSNLANHVIWHRIPEDDPIWGFVPDPAPGKKSPHIELFVDNSAAFNPIPAGFYVSAAFSVASPVSRGSLALKTNNPFDQPTIDLNLLSHPFDIYAMVSALRSARKFFSASAWDSYVLSPAGLYTDEIIDSDSAAIDVLRNTVSHGWHIVGTAAMSPKNAKYGVVDPDLRVKGVDGLRIVDASVIPRIPAAHTQAAVYAIAERAADLIKKQYKL